MRFAAVFLLVVGAGCGSPARPPLVALPEESSSPPSPKPADAATEATPATAGVGKTCDAAAYLPMPPPMVGAEGSPTREVKENVDLNGDGVKEVTVYTHDGWRNYENALLARLPAPACFREVFRESNADFALLKTKTNGWFDLSVTESSPAMGSKAETRTWKYNGSEYKPQ